MVTPADSRLRAAAMAVAPVVRTSSTRITSRPRIRERKDSSIANAPWTLERRALGPRSTWVRPSLRRRASTRGSRFLRATSSARRAAWLYPRVRRLHGVVGTGTTNGSGGPFGSSGAIIWAMRSARPRQPRYFRAWTKAPGISSRITADRADWSTVGQWPHSRQASPGACPVPRGSWHRGQKGGGGALRRLRHRGHTNPSGSSGGIRSPQATHPLGRKRSRRSSASAWSLNGSGKP